MSLETPRRSYVWNNLPLHIKGLALLMVPVPALMLAIVCLSGTLREERQALQSIDQILAARQNLADIRSILSVPANPAQDHQALIKLARDLPPLISDPGRMLEINAAVQHKLDSLAALAAAGVPAQSLLDESRDATELLEPYVSALAAEYERLLEQRLGQVRQARSKLLAQGVRGGFIFLLGELLAALVFLGAITSQVGALKANSRRLAEGAPLLPLFTDNWELNQIGRDLVTASVALGRRWNEPSEPIAAARGAEATNDALSRQAADALAADLRERNQELAAALTSAREALSAKGRFLGELSREVRVPLSSILGFSELLYDAKLGPVNEQQKGCISDILAGSKRILQLADNIVGAARAVPAATASSAAAFDLEQLLKEVNYSLVPVARRRGVRVDIELDPDLREIKADRARLYQSLERHMGNAIQCTPHDETLAVHLASEGGDALRMEFQHTGIGLAPADLVHLYPDFRVTAAAERSVSPSLAEGRAMPVPAVGQRFYVILPGVSQPVEARLTLRAQSIPAAPGASRLLN